MHGAEGIGHKDVRKGCEFFGKLGIILLLFRIEADVLQQNDLSVFHIINGGFCALAYGIFRKPNLRVGQQLGQTRADRCERILRIDLSLRAAEVRAENDLRIVLEQIPDGWQGRNNTLIVGNRTVLRERNVEIYADKHSLAADVDVLDRLFCHSLLTPLY